MRVPIRTCSGDHGPPREPIWIESNDSKEAARALEFLHAQIAVAAIDPYAWKWVIAALDHSLHTFLVAGLAGTKAAARLEPGAPGSALRFESRAPDEGADGAESGLGALYARMKLLSGFQPPEEVDQDVARLIQYHHVLFRRLPARWILQVDAMPRMTRNCLSVVEYLGWNPGRISWPAPNLTDLARVKYLASMKMLEALDSQHRSAA